MIKEYQSGALPERADFCFQELVGPYQVSGASLHANRGFFGLLKSKSMPFGSLRSEDGEIFSMVRALMAPGGTPNPVNFLFLSTLQDQVNLRLDRDIMARQGRTEQPVARLEDGVAIWENKPGDPGLGWQVTASEKGFTWREDELLSIEGRLLGSGFQWYLPGVDWGTFYVSQLYDVAGTCAGRKVKGIIALDQVYMAEGGAIHHLKDLIVNNQKHVIWWSFANVYADGSYEVGSFQVGHDHLGYAILMDETGRIRTTTKVEGEVRHKDGSFFAEHARVVFNDDEVWEFIPDARGEMIDFVNGFPITAQQEGRWRRVGDTRTPDRWMAWGESDRRNGSARNVFPTPVDLQTGKAAS